VFFKVINDSFFIAKDFDLITNIQDIQGNKALSEVGYVRNLINLNSLLKRIFSCLNSDDYLFNYLTIFLNPVRKNLFGKSSFRFSNAIDFKFVKDYLANNFRIDGFYIFQKLEVSADNQTNKKQLLFVQDSPEVSCFRNNNLKIKLNTLNNEDSKTEKVFAFSDYFFLNKFICFDLQLFENISHKDFMNSYLFSFMLHESPHCISEEINNRHNYKVTSPYIKGVHELIGENGEFFEFLIMVISFFTCSINRNELLFQFKFKS